MKQYRIAAIPGDGIGNEVLPEGIRVLEAAGKRFGLSFAFDHFDWSCEHYAKHGRMMPEGGLDRIRKHDAIFLGAVGFPGVPDHVSLWGLLIPIRRDFNQYVNLRPCRVLRGMTSPLAGRGPDDIDFFVVRENVEGEYSEIGGRMFRGTEHEAAMQESIFTRRGTDRVMRYAFDLATSGRKHVTSATKSNGIIHTMPFWDERFAAMQANYPDIRADQFHIDTLAAQFVLQPDWFDVVVGLQPLRRHPVRSWPGASPARSASRRPPISIPSASIPLDVRAGPWLGARHRRPGHRQSDRPDLVGGDDAGASRPHRTPPTP